VSDLVAFTAADHAWTVDPSHEAFVRELLAPSAREPERLPGARVVKTNRVRTVVHVAGPVGGLYCKRFRTLRGIDRLLSLVGLRRSPARREWEAFRLLRAAGVSCPEPVILAEERRGGQLVGSVLATREVDDAEQLTEKLDALRADPEGSAARQALMAALARTCQAVFAAGLDHPDVHLANFLVRPDGSLVVLDLHSASPRRGPPSARTRLRRLEKVAHSIGPQDPDKVPHAAEEVRWFAQAWADLDPALGGADALTTRLLRGADRLEARRLVSRDRRCLVNSTDFAVHGAMGVRVYRRREITAQGVWLAFDQPTEAVVHAHPRGRSRIETFLAPPLLAALGKRLLRKLYLLPRLRSRWAAFFGTPLSMRAWRAARACEVRRIPHPRHYALVIEGVIPRHAKVLMELVQDATMIHVILEQGPLPSPRQRFRLASDLGRLMGRFHASGLKHRDLAVQNLLVRAREEGWDLWVVDLDEVRVGAMSRKEKFRALVQLADLPPAATRADRARFFRAYLQAGGDRVLASELSELGKIGIGRRVAAALRKRAEAKARRLAKRPPRPEPTNVSALES
jgi:tRNA A-37 threonylcarbamoyl transferase component Bud32